MNNPIYQVQAITHDNKLIIVAMEEDFKQAIVKAGGYTHVFPSEKVQIVEVLMTVPKFKPFKVVKVLETDDIMPPKTPKEGGEK